MSASDAASGVSKVASIEATKAAYLAADAKAQATLAKRKEAEADFYASKANLPAGDPILEAKRAAALDLIDTYADDKSAAIDAKYEYDRSQLHS